MKSITVMEIPDALDKKINRMKVEMELGNKSSTVVKIIEEYFKEKERKDIEKLKEEINNWTAI
jgi:hypothetical protein